MDIKTLEALGLTKEDLAERIVDQAVSLLLRESSFDEEGNVAGSYSSKFKREIDQRVKDAVDAKITALAEEHLIPRVGELIEKADMRQTNRYGETTSAPMTFKEFIAARAETYMSEDVDLNCNSKAESGDSYNWRSCGPRLTVLMRIYIRDTLERSAKAAVTDVNKVISKNIEKAAIEAIAAAAANLKVAVAS